MEALPLKLKVRKAPLILGEGHASGSSKEALPKEGMDEAKHDQEELL